MKIAILLFALSIPALAHPPIRGPHQAKQGQALTFTFDNPPKDGNAVILLIGQHGDRATVLGTMKGGKLTFTVPAIAFDEWQVIDVTIDGKLTHIGAINGPLFTVQK